MVETLLYPHNLLTVLLREGSREVTAHDRTAVAYQVIDNREEYIGEDVQHPEGQEREDIKERVNKRISYPTHHQLCISCSFL